MLSGSGPGRLARGGSKPPAGFLAISAASVLAGFYFGSMGAGVVLGGADRRVLGWATLSGVLALLYFVNAFTVRWLRPWARRLAVGLAAVQWLPLLVVALSEAGVIPLAGRQSLPVEMLTLSWPVWLVVAVPGVWVLSYLHKPDIRKLFRPR